MKKIILDLSNFFKDGIEFSLLLQFISGRRSPVLFDPSCVASDLLVFQHAFLRMI